MKACAVGRGCMGESNQRQDAPWTSGAHHTYVTAVKAEMEEGSVPTKLLLPRFSSLSGVRKMHTGECSMHRNVSPRRHRCNSETAHLASRPTSTPHQHHINAASTLTTTPVRDSALAHTCRPRSSRGKEAPRQRKSHSQDVGVVHVARQLIPLVGAWVTSEPVAVIVPRWSFCGVVPCGQRNKGGGGMTAVVM